MKKLLLMILVGAATNALISENATAAGISVDAGLTPPEDRWILASLSRTIRHTHRFLQQYQFSAAVKELREFFWDSLCESLKMG